MNEKINLTALHVFVVLIPASLILYYSLNAGMLPDNDYWGFITHFLTEQGGFSTKITDWVKRDNEHYVLFPKIIYALNIILTDGNNVTLSLFAWFMALLQVFLLYQLIPFNARQQPVLFTVLLFVIAAFIFSPTLAHNWFFGMSGVAWISANFFAVSTIFSISQYAKTERKRFLVLTFIFSLFAVATYSTSLSLFPTLIIACFLLKLKPIEQVSILLFSILILSLYLSTYSTPDQHPSLNQPVYTLGSYFFAFIGSIFTKQKLVAIIIAFIGLISSLFMVIVVYKKQTYWKAILPWVFIQLYVCGNAAMAALARSGFTVEQAFSSRYGSLPALFWIAWTMIASTFSFQIEKQYRRYSFIALISISGILIVNKYYIGVGIATPFIQRAEYKNITLAALYSHAFDVDLIHKTLITGVPMAYMEPLTKILEVNQHIPFNGIFNKCPKMGTQLTRIHDPIDTQFYGQVDELKLGRNLVVELRGWANNNNHNPQCIAFTNSDNVVKGIASYGLNRFDIPKAIPTVLNDQTGWQGYGNFKIPDQMIKVFMLSEYDQYWIPLMGYYQIFPYPPYWKRIDAYPKS